MSLALPLQLVWTSFSLLYDLYVPWIVRNNNSYSFVLWHVWSYITINFESWYKLLINTFSQDSPAYFIVCRMKGKKASCCRWLIHNTITVIVFEQYHQQRIESSKVCIWYWVYSVCLYSYHSSMWHVFKNSPAAGTSSSTYNVPCSKMVLVLVSYLYTFTLM